MNIQKLMRKAQQMQERVQAEMAELVVEASAGGGMVTVTVSGDLIVKSITIDPEAIDPEDPELLQDMVGEVANTLSGNARRSFGSNFMISVPVVLMGGEKIRVPASIKTFVIPIIWRQMRSYLIVCLE